EAVRLDDAALRLSVGRRFSAVIPRSAIDDVRAVSWNDVPPSDRETLNAMKPATPNVALKFREPIPIRVLGTVSRPVRLLTLTLAEPARFLAAIDGPASPERST